jgi:selenocysteine lyase/cysteine desulfurase
MLNALGIYALGAALELLLEMGPAAIERRVLSLADQAGSGLAEMGFEIVSSRRPGETSGIVAAVHPRLPAAELVERLAGRGIVVSTRAGRLRVAPHAYNTEGEIERLLVGLRAEIQAMS